MYTTRYTRKKIEETLDILTKNHPPIRTASWIIDQRWPDNNSDPVDAVSAPFIIENGKTITLPPAKIANENENVLVYIRKHTHAYVAVPTNINNNFKLKLKQLDDTDRTKYNNGTSAINDIKNYDVFIKFDFDIYYKTESAIPDDETEPNRDYVKLTITTKKHTDVGWNKWDKNKLIAVYESSYAKYAYKNIIVSRSNSKPYVNSYNALVNFAEAKGEGYHICDYDYVRFFRLLFYAWNEQIDSQNSCGFGTKNSVKGTDNIITYYPKITGNTDKLGMTDTTIDTGTGEPDSTIDENQIKEGKGPHIVSTNFWGIENFYSDMNEYIRNIQHHIYSPNAGNTGFIQGYISEYGSIKVTDPIFGTTTTYTSIDEFETKYPASFGFIAIFEDLASDIRIIPLRHISQGFGTCKTLIFGDNADVIPKTIQYPKLTEFGYYVDEVDVRDVNKIYISSGYSNLDAMNTFKGVQDENTAHFTSCARLMFIGTDETIEIDNI